MPEDNAKTEAVDEGVVARVSKLKKAGLPIAAVVLLAIVGAPGFWEKFFNDDEEEALAKVEISYQLLKQHTETIGAQLIDYRKELDDLRSLLNTIMLQRAAVATYPNRLPSVASPRRLTDLPDTLDDAAEDTSVGRREMASAGLEPTDL